MILPKENRLPVGKKGKKHKDNQEGWTSFYKLLELYLPLNISWCRACPLPVSRSPDHTHVHREQACQARTFLTGQDHSSLVRTSEEYGQAEASLWCSPGKDQRRVSKFKCRSCMKWRDTSEASSQLCHTPLCSHFSHTVLDLTSSTKTEGVCSWRLQYLLVHSGPWP